MQTQGDIEKSETNAEKMQNEARRALPCIPFRLSALRVPVSASAKITETYQSCDMLAKLRSTGVCILTLPQVSKRENKGEKGTNMARCIGAGLLQKR